MGATESFPIESVKKLCHLCLDSISVALTDPMFPDGVIKKKILGGTIRLNSNNREHSCINMWHDILVINAHGHFFDCGLRDREKTHDCTNTT